MPEVSVIVPVYKVEKYIHRCVDSILAQTFTDFELILVDDSSPDNCGAICDEYAAKDSRIRVIHKENGGVSSARNAGLDIATGKYISFCDSDDYVDHCFFEKMLCQHADLSICGFSMIDPNNTITYTNEHFLSGSFPVTKENIGFWFDQGYLYSVWRCLFNREIINKCQLRFDQKTSRGEDTIFVLSYLKYCNSVFFCPDVLYNYIRYGGGTLTTSLNCDNIISLAYLDNYLFNWFSHNQITSQSFHSISYWTRRELREQFFSTLKNPDVSIYHKYCIARAFCQISDYYLFINRFLENEHPKYRLIIKSRCPLLILIYHVVLNN